jgi:excisionase family DNA binding protein
MNEKQISTDRVLLNQKNEAIEGQRIYTDREAAKYLRVGQTTLWRLRKAGKISFRRASSKILYTQMDLENYLQSIKREAFACAA